MNRIQLDITMEQTVPDYLLTTVSDELTFEHVCLITLRKTATPAGNVCKALSRLLAVISNFT